MEGENHKQEINAQAPEKLLIDDLSNFQFHAAYLVYAETFDGVRSAEAKRELNRNIEDLKEGQIDYETFYMNIAQYRKGAPMQQHPGRIAIQTQRKKDWRVKSQRQERIRRHKK